MLLVRVYSALVTMVIFLLPGLFQVEFCYVIDDKKGGATSPGTKYIHCSYSRL